MDSLLLKIVQDGTSKDLGEGALSAVMTMLCVFLILSVIIVITYYVGNFINKASSKVKIADKKESAPIVPEKTINPLNLEDEDAVVASLVASIDFRNQIKKDVKVVSIKEIK